MKKRYQFALYSGVLLANLSPAQAQNTLVQAMAEQPMPGEYKLTREAFEDAYAFNDTARAIIRMRYAKRNTGLNIARWAPLPVPLLALIGRHQNPTVTVTNTTVTVSPNSYYYDSWVAPTAFSLLGVSLAGLILAGNHSREQLYREVRQYRLTRRLPATVHPAALVPYLLEVRQDGVLYR